MTRGRMPYPMAARMPVHQTQVRLRMLEPLSTPAETPERKSQTQEPRPMLVTTPGSPSATLGAHKPTQGR